MTGRKRRGHLSEREVDRVAISQADDPDAWGKAVTVQPARRHGYQERVVLLRDLPDEGLRKDDVGTIVEHHPATGDAPEGCEVEFFAANGATVAVAAVPTDAVRPATERDLLSIRREQRNNTCFQD